MVSKGIKQGIMLLLMVALALTGLNVVLALLSIPMPIVGSLILILSLISIPAVIFARNEFKFKSMLDLTLFGFIIAVMAFLGIGVATWIPATDIFATHVFGAFTPLVMGIVVGGIVTLAIGFVMTIQTGGKKSRKRRR